MVEVAAPALERLQAGRNRAQDEVSELQQQLEAEQQVSKLLAVKLREMEEENKELKQQLEEANGLLAEVRTELGSDAVWSWEAFESSEFLQARVSASLTVVTIL